MPARNIHLRSMTSTLLACALAALALPGCGGSEGAGASAPLHGPAAAPQQRALAQSGVSTNTAVVTTPGPPPAPVVTTAPEKWVSGRAPVRSPTTPPASAVQTTAALVADATAPTRLVAGAAGLRSLTDATPESRAGSAALAATPNCQLGYVVPAELVADSAAALPQSGGIFHTERELATWRSRIGAGHFVSDGDWRPGSPGDWDRIRGNARHFVERGEPTAPVDEPARWNHGHRARDAAFTHLITADATALAAVRGYLRREAQAAQNDFVRTRCIRDAAGAARDGFFAEAAWLARYVATYDFVRRDLAEPDRLLIENYLRRNAWFLAAHMDHFLAYLFPARLAGDYSRRSGDAAASGATAGWSSTVDSNGDCHIDGRDDPTPYPGHAYARADGSLGPRASVLSQWFNNRRATHALAITATGVLLGDAGLVARGKRYVMEWLTYTVNADGSSGEFARNGEYCIARQGLIYHSLSLQAGLMGARLLQRQGDASLVNFSTRDGLFGSESGSGQPPKSLEGASDTYLRIVSGALDWYQAEPHQRTQAPREATSLARMDVRYMGGAVPMDDFHELTLLSSAAAVPRLPVAQVLLREGSASTLRWPGASGNAVDTGAGAWTDAWGVLPAAYLLRP